MEGHGAEAKENEEENDEEDRHEGYYEGTRTSRRMKRRRTRMNEYDDKGGRAGKGMGMDEAN